MECEQCKLLEKEVAKLKKQVNLKNRKIAKLRKQKDEYAEEIDKLDVELANGIEVCESISKDESRCPKCGKLLDEIKTLLGFCIMTCVCGFRRTE